MAQGGSGAEEDFSRPQDVAIRLHRTIRALAKAFCLKELFHVVGREERDLTQGQKRYFGLFIIALWHGSMKLSPTDAVMRRTEARKKLESSYLSPTGDPMRLCPYHALACAMTAKTGVPFTREEFLSVCDEFKGTGRKKGVHGLNLEAMEELLARKNLTRNDFESKLLSVITEGPTLDELKAGLEATKLLEDGKRNRSDPEGRGRKQRGARGEEGVRRGGQRKASRKRSQSFDDDDDENDDEDDEPASRRRTSSRGAAAGPNDVPVPVPVSARNRSGAAGEPTYDYVQQDLQLQDLQQQLLQQQHQQHYHHQQLQHQQQLQQQQQQQQQQQPPPVHHQQAAYFRRDADWRQGQQQPHHLVDLPAFGQTIDPANSALARMLNWRMHAMPDNGVAGSFQPHLSAYNTHPSAPPAVAPVQQQDPPAAFTQEQAQATLDLAEVAAEFEEMFEELASAPDQAPAAIQGSVIQGVPILGQQAAAAAAAVSAQLAPEAPLGSARWTQAVLERVSSLRAEISPDAQAGPGGTQQQPGAPLRNSSLLRLRSLRSLVEDAASGGSPAAPNAQASPPVRTNSFQAFVHRLLNGQDSMSNVLPMGAASADVIDPSIAAVIPNAGPLVGQLLRQHDAAQRAALEQRTQANLSALVEADKMAFMAVQAGAQVDPSAVRAVRDLAVSAVNNLGYAQQPQPPRLAGSGGLRPRVSPSPLRSSNTVGVGMAGPSGSEQMESPLDVDLSRILADATDYPLLFHGEGALGGPNP